MLMITNPLMSEIHQGSLGLPDLDSAAELLCLVGRDAHDALQQLPVDASSEVERRPVRGTTTGRL